MPSYLKPELDAIKVPTVIDIAWSAGFYEGEGHCSAVVSKAAIMVTQKDTELLYKLRDWFGGRVYFARCKSVRPDTQCHVWKAFGDRARLFLALVYPYLSSRRKAQADATHILDFLGDRSPSEFDYEEIRSMLDVKAAYSKVDPIKKAKRSQQMRDSYLRRMQNPEYASRTRANSLARSVKRRQDFKNSQSDGPERVM
jgi:hypothetical protein